MIRLTLITATLLSTAVAVSPSIAQENPRGSARISGTTAAAPAPGGGAAIRAGGSARFSAETGRTMGGRAATNPGFASPGVNVRAAQTTTTQTTMAPTTMQQQRFATGSSMGTWNQGNNWNRNNWDWNRHRRSGWGPGFAVGFGTGYYGAPYYDSYAYGGYPYDDTYAYYDDDDDGYVGATVGTGGDAAYCAQRYRSYDPASGTFLGYDGQRHPCP